MHRGFVESITQWNGAKWTCKSASPLKTKTEAMHYAIWRSDQGKVVHDFFIRYVLDSSGGPWRVRKLHRQQPSLIEIELTDAYPHTHGLISPARRHHSMAMSLQVCAP